MSEIPCSAALEEAVWVVKFLSLSPLRLLSPWTLKSGPIYKQWSFLLVKNLLSLKSWLNHILDLLPDLSLWNGRRKLNAIALQETYPVKPNLSQNGLAVKYVCVSVWSLNQPLVIELGFGRPSYRTEADWFYWPSKQPQTFAGFVFTIFAPHAELVTPTFVLT